MTSKGFLHTKRYSQESSISPPVSTIIICAMTSFLPHHPGQIVPYAQFFSVCGSRSEWERRGRCRGNPQTKLTNSGAGDKGKINRKSGAPAEPGYCIFPPGRIPPHPARQQGSRMQCGGNPSVPGYNRQSWRWAAKLSGAGHRSWSAGRMMLRPARVVRRPGVLGAEATRPGTMMTKASETPIMP